MWKCPKCEKDFEEINQSHSCNKIITDIDSYINEQPAEKREILFKVKNTIKSAAPNSVECIKWAMPTFFQKENLIHFAYNKNHLGIYPGDKGVCFFKNVLDSKGYKYTKGAIQFPWSNPIPFELIKEITLHRVSEVSKIK